jgi:hypothetical protein
MEASGQLHALAAIPPGIGGCVDPQSWSVRCREEKKKNSLTAGNRNPAVQPVAIPTDVSRIIKCMLTPYFKDYF